MKKLLLPLLLCCYSFGYLLAQQTQPSSDGGGVKGTPPMFPGCEDMEDIKEQRKCAEVKMFQFLYGHIKYPPDARKNGTEGTVIIHFVVEEDGYIADAKIIKNIGDGCGEEALRVVESMPEWIPAIKEGNPVSHKIAVPIKFSLGLNAKQ